MWITGLVNKEFHNRMVHLKKISFVDGNIILEK